jgi:hypothetical protein
MRCEKLREASRIALREIYVSHETALHARPAAMMAFFGCVCVLSAPFWLQCAHIWEGLSGLQGRGHTPANLAAPSSVEGAMEA